MLFRSSRCRCMTIDVHYLHVPGKGPKPLSAAVAATAGRGSVFMNSFEYSRLTDPAKFGGDAKRNPSP